MMRYSKWIAVGAVVLMLLSMFAYVVTNDEAYPPGPPPAAEQEADV